MRKSLALWMTGVALGAMPAVATAQATGAGAPDVAANPALAPQPAGADTASQETRAAASGGLTDIIVTARRREERLQSVPISATAFDQGKLERQNVRSITDLLGQVPSLSVAGAGQSRSSENITIRGQGASFNAAPGVVQYFAEVPLPQDQQNNAQGAGGAYLYDLANVQVLRGPQGTLFGRNTTGGAVLFEPQRPTNRLEGYGQVTYGNYQNVELKGAINVPLVDDTLLVRVAGIFQKRDGFTHELTTDTDLDNRNRYSVRLGVTWKPAPGIENYLLATMSHVQEHGTGTVLNAVPGLGGSGTSLIDPNLGVTYASILRRQQALGIRTVYSSPLLYSERLRYYALQDIFSAELADTLTFRNIASYSRLKHGFPLDQDGYPDDDAVSVALRGPTGLIGTNEIDPGAPFYPKYNYTTDIRQITEEAQLQGRAGDGALTYVVGGYYENVKPLGPELQGTYQSPPDVSQQFSNSKALYAQGTLSFGSFSDALDGLKLTAGVRYTWDSIRATGKFLLPIPAAITQSTKASAPNWTVGLDYNVAKSILLYAKASRGYKTGGVSRANPNPALRSFKPEYVTSFEGGIKADWHLGGIPIRTNVDYYYTKYDDLQRTGGTLFFYTIPGGGPTVPVFGAQTVNAGKAHIQGLEFEGEIRPAKWLTISGNYSYMDAKYDTYRLPSLFPPGNREGRRYVSYLASMYDTYRLPSLFPPGNAFGFPAGSDCGAGVPYNAASNQCVLDNIPFQFAPKHQYSITGTVELPTSEEIGKMTVSATWSFIGAQYGSPTKAPQAETYAYIGGGCKTNAAGAYQCGPHDGYGLLNLNFTWSNVAQSNFDLSAFATNALAKKYIISSNGITYQSGFNSLIYGEPRMYGFSLRYRFGG